MDMTCACGAPRANGTKCRECYNAYMKDYMARTRKNDPRKAKAQYLRRTYNITIDQYDQMLADQNGQCAICGTNEPEWFDVDHDHACCDKKGSCGACVRGLLCNDCNTAIARLKDSPTRARAAASYLERTGR